MRPPRTLIKLYVIIVILVSYTVCLHFTKYILLWTPQQSKHVAPFNYFGKYYFTSSNCTHRNCYITSNKSFLDDYTKFDAILFNGRQVTMNNKDLPKRRNPNQLYVFVQLESADRFPVCRKIFDTFFNRTFTYRLDSDFLWPYMHIRNMNGDIIGPRVNMTWIRADDMLPVSVKLVEKLKYKNKAAAWFVTNCGTRSSRERFVRLLQKELARFNLSVDIYGKCGTFKCPRDSNRCDRYLEKDYFFYLALENSFDEDYVTEKLLTGLLNDAVPIVYGGANYTRFMPNGSYIDGRHLGALKTAQTIFEIMTNHTRYQNMFRWKQHYQFSSSWPPPMCPLCEHLHKPQKPQNHKNFRKWWYPNYKKRCINPHR